MRLHTITNIFVYLLNESTVQISYIYLSVSSYLMAPFVKCKFSFVYLQLIFEGTAGSSYAGDIAIDDVLIVDATCPKEGIEKFLLHFVFM